MDLDGTTGEMNGMIGKTNLTGTIGEMIGMIGKTNLNGTIGQMDGMIGPMDGMIGKMNGVVIGAEEVVGIWGILMTKITRITIVVDGGMDVLDTQKIVLIIKTVPF